MAISIFKRENKSYCICISK